MSTGSITRRAAGAALCALLASAPTFAVSVGDETRLPQTASRSYYDDAEVVRVSPHYAWREVSEPVQHCTLTGQSGPGAYRYGVQGDGHPSARRHGTGAAAGFLGALVGGLVGHQFGGGDGKAALTVAGAALGASIARDHVRRRRVEPYAGSYGYPATVRRCTTSSRIERVRSVRGYDVAYRYQGQTFHKRVNEHPGSTIRIHVDVEPVE